MSFQLCAACGSNVGKVRSNHEDNFYFQGRGLPMENRGLSGIAAAKFPLTNACCFAVFDGMGGVEFGEVASFLATDTLITKMSSLHGYPASAHSFLEEVCDAMNAAICYESEKCCSGRMGTTAAMVLFTPDRVHACNLGDSRIYRLRNQEIVQISQDHVETFPPGMRTRRKPRLTQHLGIYPDEMALEPHIVSSDLRRGDIYLLCSDGLSDMLSDSEIDNCLRSHASVRQSVAHLIKSALTKGGRDNVTAIVIQVR